MEKSTNDVLDDVLDDVVNDLMAIAQLLNLWANTSANSNKKSDVGAIWYLSGRVDEIAKRVDSCLNR
ncbi:MAG: hypothetical protein LBG67_01710 [Campylobacteraceae bacterium]|nr:hypothetical protein [Campylobacteraceae bacterium]